MPTPPPDEEPSYDPYDDQPTGPQHADRAAEHALLATLIHTPTSAPHITTLVDPDDFNWPEHTTIWTTWQNLNNGTPPDPVTLNNQLLRSRDTRAVRALADITLTTPNPAHADHYARIIRDHARLRALTNTAARLSDLARRGHPDQIDRTLGDAIQTLEDAAMRYGPRDPHTTTGRRDLTWILTGEPPTMPPPVYVQRTDGTALFYASQVNGIFGDPETAKTWLAQIAIVEALNNNQRAAMIDVDHNGPNHTAARLLLLGARPDHLADPNRFRYYEPEDADELHHAIDDLVTWTPHVLLVDSIGEVFPLLGINSNDPDEVSSALRLVATRPANTGACVITIDHLPKAHEARATGFAIGATAKKRMIRGAYLRAETRTPPAPGHIGRITLRIEKDTAGELRKTSGGGYAGTFTLDSTSEHTTTWSIGIDQMPKNDDGSPRPTTLMEKVATYVADNEGCTQRDIERDVPGTAKYLRQAIQVLVSEGHITRTQGANRRMHHTLTIPYREAEDDHAQQTL